MAVYVFFQRFRRSKSNKNRLGQKFKIPVAYVFLYDHFASVHPFWWKSDESPRTSSRKCVKMPHFDLLFDLCDLDLGHMTLSFAPGRSVTQYQYSLQVSRKSDDGKGAKRVWRTDGRPDVYCESMQIAREDSCSAVYSSYVIIINSILSISRAVFSAQCVHWNLSILWYRGTFR